MKTTKFMTLILFGLLVSTVSLTVNAQDDPPPEGTKKEKIDQLKIAFITKELDLTTQEAEKFWPVYNEMENKVKEQRKLQRATADELRDQVETLSDADIKKKSEVLFDAEIKTAELHKEYHTKIASIIGYKKAAKLLSLEKRFKRELLNKLNEPPGPPPGPHGPGKPPGGPHGMPE